MKEKIVSIMVIIIVLNVFASLSEIHTNSAKEDSKINDFSYSKVFLSKIDKLQSISTPSPPTGLTNSSIIAIVGNAQISPHSSGGDGTPNNPYQIKYLNITQNSARLISIQNTTQSIIIEFCYFNSVAGFGKGIYLNNASNIKIENNFMENIAYGVDGTKFTSNIISNNTFYSSTIGISVTHIQKSSISFNYFILKINNGISVSFSTSISISNNYILNSSYAIQSNSNIDGTDISNNLILNSTIVAISAQLENGDKVFSNTIITTLGMGVLMSNQNDGSLTNNSISASISIFLDYSFNNLVQNNKLLNSGNYGIYMVISDNNTIDNNYITNSTNYGIIVYTSNWNHFSNNILKQNLANGTALIQSNDSSIVNSTFESSGSFGLILINGSNIKVIENVFNGSQKYDIFIQHEIGSIFERNAFLDINLFGGAQVFDGGIKNVFSFNYWAGWTAPDLNSDGFVDYARLIDGPANSIDNYPLAFPDQIINPFKYDTNSITAGETNIQNTSSTSKVSPGFTFVAFIIGFIGISMFVLTKRKKL